MRIKLAVWTLQLTLSLAVAWGGACFAQTYPANAAESDWVEDTRAPLDDVLEATVLPKSTDHGDIQADFQVDEETSTRMNDAAAVNSDGAVSEAAGQAGATTSRKSIAFSRIGIGVKASTLGAGIEVGTPLSREFNLRGGFNMFRYNRPITDNGIHYDGHLQFQSAEGHLDWFPFGGFHISPGILFYNGNRVTATASVPGGQNFSVGGTTYESDPTTPVTGDGKLDFVRVSPTLMLGVGNLIPRNGRHYSFLFEVGAAYQGSSQVALNLEGNVCAPGLLVTCRPVASDPTVQANIQAQQSKIEHDVNPYRFYPVVSLGVGFNF